LANAGVLGMSMKSKICVLLFLLVSAFASVSYGQFSTEPPDGYVEVTDLRKTLDLYLGCFISEDHIYNETEFLNVKGRDKRCAEAAANFEINFEKQTLIGYSVGGDCHLHVRTKLFRSDTEKKYKLIVNKYYGGCRAGGWRSGWIAADKFPDGYAFESVEVGTDERVRRKNGPDKFFFPKPDNNR